MSQKLPEIYLEDEIESKKYKKITIAPRILVKHITRAEKLASREDELNFAIAIISQIAKFDGEHIPFEDVEELDTEVLQHLTNFVGKHLGKNTGASSQKKNLAKK